VPEPPVETRSPPRLRALLGLDRSREPARQTATARPLRPWTLPNAITFARLAAIPAFLALALTSAHGELAAATALFAVIGWGDFADGAAARLTGQYSRLGALLDPATDRLLALAGAAVCMRFALLPRWALGLLIARELFMLVLGRYALHRGLDLRINSLGRAAIVPVMGALFFAMVPVRTLALVLLYLGLALALAATARYLRSGLAQLREKRPMQSPPAV
jgi:phosphatidylglycerophosphate synthase